MRTKIALSALFTLLSTTALMQAQTEVKTPIAPDAHVKDAAAKVESGMPLQFGVSGLTKENVDKVKQSLMSMETQVYLCEGCKHEQAAPGRCAPCNLDTKATKKTLFSEAMPSVETATIRVTPLATRSLLYSDLEAALMKSSIQIDAAKFPIAGNSLLVLLGGTAENAKVIEKALVDAKLFDSVKADYVAASGEIHVQVHASATPPTRAKLISTIDGLGTKAKLSDVVWGPRTTPIKA